MSKNITSFNCLGHRFATLALAPEAPPKLTDEHVGLLHKFLDGACNRDDIARLIELDRETVLSKVSTNGKR